MLKTLYRIWCFQPAYKNWLLISHCTLGLNLGHLCINVAQAVYYIWELIGCRPYWSDLKTAQWTLPELSVNVSSFRAVSIFVLVKFCVVHATFNGTTRLSLKWQHTFSEKTKQVKCNPCLSNKQTKLQTCTCFPLLYWLLKTGLSIKNRILSTIHIEMNLTRLKWKHSSNGTNLYKYIKAYQ